jgi:penicillin-binding protein 2
MKKSNLLLLFLLFLSACNLIPSPEDSYDLSTLTPLPTESDFGTPTAVPDGAEGVALTFFRAWESGDYLGMYSLLSPGSQALIDSQAFINRYTGALNTAGVITVKTQPLAAYQEGDRASVQMRVTWQTAVVGDLVRDHEVELVYSQARWGISWHEGLILPELAGGNRLAMQYRNPARANVYDVNGTALAFQGSAFTLGVVPGRITDEAGLLNVLSPLLGKTGEEIKEMYAAAAPDWLWPVGDISTETYQAIYTSLEPYLQSGALQANQRLTRLYPEGGIAPHIVGYTGRISPEQLSSYQTEGFQGDEIVGLSGVELWGEDYLNGERGGTLTVVGPAGELITTLVEQEPRQARSVYTTLDAPFQQAVQQALADALTSHPLGFSGAIVVLDVNNGNVLAMGSYPGYDPAIFDPLNPNPNLSAVLNDSSQPLLNRATQVNFPPGSIFKIVTFSAGIASGLYTPETAYTSTGTWNRLGDAYIKRDWRTGGHGTVSLREALVVSCNSCFYDVGYNIDGVDQWLLPNTANAFGFGQPTQIVGISEVPGFIGNPEWKMNTYGEGWSTGDTVNMSIGQGFVDVTPLQIANMFAALANGGTLYRPTVIDRIGSGGGAPEEPLPAQVLGQLPISPEILGAIQQSLFRVTTANSGTATDRFAGLVVPVAGKTGTAEAANFGAPHAWFGGYAPAGPYTLANGTVVTTPQIAVVVFAENTGEGSAVAAPIFRRVIELYYGITPLTPYPW